jgi:hypothetical protein
MLSANGLYVHSTQHLSLSSKQVHVSEFFLVTVCCGAVFSTAVRHLPLNSAARAVRGTTVVHVYERIPRSFLAMQGSGMRIAKVSNQDPT